MPSKDPLDDIEAILTSICNQSKPSDEDNNALADLLTNINRAETSPGIASRLKSDDARPPEKPFRNSRRASETRKNPREVPLKRQGKFKASAIKRSVKARHDETKTARTQNKSRQDGLKPHRQDTLQNPQETKPTTSSDEADNKRFMSEMKRLAEAKREVRLRVAL